jgi:predicted nucleotidyltransferase component of viral defense system
MNAVPNKSDIEEVALELGINPAFVEKDWYLVQILKIIGFLDLFGAQAIFAGGTALAKAHGLLKRFSEDIDFRLVVPVLSSYSRSQQKKHLSMLKGLIHDAIVSHIPDSGSQVVARD